LAQKLEERELLMGQIHPASIHSHFVPREVDAQGTDLDAFLAGKLTTSPLGPAHAHVQFGRNVRKQDEVVETIVAVEPLGLPDGDRDKAWHLGERVDRTDAYEGGFPGIVLVQRFDQDRGWRLLCEASVAKGIPQVRRLDSATKLGQRGHAAVFAVENGTRAHDQDPHASTSVRHATRCDGAHDVPPYRTKSACVVSIWLPLRPLVRTIRH
jgi:hypothetical protein